MMRPEYDIRGGVRGKYFTKYLANMTPAQRARNAYVARHRLQGLCVLCPRKAVSGLTRCAPHREAAWKKVDCGFCTRPIAPPRNNGQLYHPSCALKAARYHKRYWWATTLRTEAYIRGHRRAARAYQKRHRARGLCATCPRRTTFERCWEHRQ